MTESDQTPNPPQYLSQDQEMDTLEQRGTGDPLDEGLSPAEKVDDGEVGTQRAGRLVDPDAGIGEDTEKDLVGDDVGLDDASSTAEEAAMHIVDEE
jgi:hypothetical protein